MPGEEKKPNPVVEGLMARRTVLLDSEITVQEMTQLAARLITLQTQSSDPIKLLIDSGGGGTYPALQMCDIISSLITVPVHGIAIGACGSAATFIMLHCTKRMSTRYSRFLIHSGTRSQISVPISPTSSEHVEQLLKDVRATEELTTRMYMERLTPKAWFQTNPPEDEKRAFVRKLIDRGDQPFDRWFSAEHAIEIGLIEEITSTKLDIFQQAKE